MTAELKLYYPQVLEWFDSLHSLVACTFSVVLAQPAGSPTGAHRNLAPLLSPTQLPVRVEQRGAQIARSVPLTQDEAIVRPAELMVLALCAADPSATGSHHPAGSGN
jgi:hypothetical protein